MSWAGAGAEAELLLDVIHVGLDGPLGDEQLLSDLHVGESTCDQAGDFVLPAGQRVVGATVGIGERLGGSSSRVRTAPSAVT